MSIKHAFKKIGVDVCTLVQNAIFADKVTKMWVTICKYVRYLCGINISSRSYFINTLCNLTHFVF